MQILAVYSQLDKGDSTILDKQKELLKRMNILVQEIDKAKNKVDDEKIEYLNKYKSWLETVIKKLQDGLLSSSKGGLIGTMRGISEFDSLASINELYDAAADVDIFYKMNCQEW